MRNFHLCLMIGLTGLLTACGGDGGGDSASGLNSGIAVDPYIVGAEFEEIAADGQTVLQSSSTASDENGRFSFAADISDGSTIRIKDNVQALHANAPYGGVIKRQVFADDAPPFVVSPLTTLVANGMTPAAVVQMMSGAGFTGLAEGDVFADPMAGLVNQTGTVTAADLALLQANMAAHAFMTAIQDFNYGGAATAAVPAVAFADCAAAVQNILSPTTFQQLAGSLGSDFTVGDLANAAVIATRAVVDGIRQEVAAGNQAISSAMVEQLTANAMLEIETIAGNFHQGRTGGGGSTPPAADPTLGQTLFVSSCSGCHTAGTGSGTMELSGDGAKVTTRFANGTVHNGEILTAGQIADVAAYLDSLGGTTPPPTTDPGTDPGTERTGQQVYDQECAGCHAMGSHDTTDTWGDLAGMGSAIVPKIEGDHQGKAAAITTAELTALADFADTFVADPGTPPTTSCDSCHGYPETSGAHTAHLALNGVDCNSCHANNNHNDGWVDLNFPAEWDAASGPATDNLDGTCSNIICHGGERTPDWNTGTIGASQCDACHAAGTSQYNSYSSGDHSDHRSYDCTVCHDPAKLAEGGHFTDLSTPGFEQDPATSIDSSLSYDGQTCQSCHGSATW